ncbi:hypothetical protein C3L33_14214, partial [Rhododendron williamsianum]
MDVVARQVLLSVNLIVVQFSMDVDSMERILERYERYSYAEERQLISTDLHTQNQLMHESISELQKKDKALQEQNNLLAKKVKEREKTQAQEAQLEQQNNDLMISSLGAMPQLLHPFNNIGGANYQEDGGFGGVKGAPIQNQNTQMMPPWMFRHMNG